MDGSLHCEPYNCSGGPRFTRYMSMTKSTKEDYDWINDPFDEKKIAEERERLGMSGTSKTFVGVGCLLFVLGFIALIGLLLFGIL